LFFGIFFFVGRVFFRVGFFASLCTEMFSVSFFFLVFAFESWIVHFSYCCFFCFVLFFFGVFLCLVLTDLYYTGFLLFSCSVFVCVLLTSDVFHIFILGIRGHPVVFVVSRVILLILILLY